MIIDTATILDITRFIVGILILGYASYTDIKTRRAANILWLLMGGIGAVLLVIQVVFVGIKNPFYLIFVPIMILLMYGFFQLRLIFGGADAKALMALAILVPLQPTLGATLPLWGSSVLPAPWVIFSNSVAIFLVIPLSLLLYNLIRRDVAFPYCLLGYKMSLEKAKQNFIWPLERIDEEGIRHFVYMPKDFDVENELLTFEQQGITRIWVTPKIPFMIPLLIGFIFTFLIGDILFFLMRALI